MKKIIIAALLFSASFSAFSQKETTKYISENFVILGARAVKVKTNTYVKEISARDFKTNNNSVIEGFGVGNEMFVDNGKFNDQKANDGIYTSVDTYQTKADKGTVVTLSNKIVVGTNFMFQKELDNYISQNPELQKFGVKVKCDINSCSCQQCHCRACDYTWGQSLNWCFTLKNCSIEVDLGW